MPCLYFFEKEVYLTQFYYYKKKINMENMEIFEFTTNILNIYLKKFTTLKQARAAIFDNQNKFLTDEFLDEDFKNLNFEEK